jgi:hypothetical protein
MPKCSIRSVWSQSRKRLPTATTVEVSAHIRCSAKQQLAGSMIYPHLKFNANTRHINP